MTARDCVRLFLLFAYGCVLAPGADPRPPELLEVRRIWDRAKHNAFTDLVRFQDRWICVFREGDSHASGDGRLRVITSTNGTNWTSAALIERPGTDLRDAKITVTPDGELMLSGAAAHPAPSPFRHQSLTWFSADATTWSEAHEVADRDHWLWRTTWRGDTAYGIGYGTQANRGVLRLYRSRDGKVFQTLVPDMLEDSYPNETSILFRENGTAHCLLRRDGARKTAMLGVAQPPYRDWTWRDLGLRIGGPHMIGLPDGRTIAAVRLYDGGARTSLCWLDPEAGTLRECLKLPSGGDTSYAGLVWHEDRLWVSYYSSHEKPTAVYLATVAIPPRR